MPRGSSYLRKRQVSPSIYACVTPESSHSPSQSHHHPAATMEVPTASSLKDIYPDDAIATQTKRWEHLLAEFKKLYGKPADFVSRSPGRVNIIGEVCTRQPVLCHKDQDHMS